MWLVEEVDFQEWQRFSLNQSPLNIYTTLSVQNSILGLFMEVFLVDS